MADQTINVAAAHPDDLQAFKRELQDALLVAVIDRYGVYKHHDVDGRN